MWASLVKADVDTELLDRSGVALGSAVRPGEQAVQFLGRAKDKANATGNGAIQRADVRSRLRLGGGHAREERGGGGSGNKKTIDHCFFSSVFSAIT
jgi:hypothetical protein